jgi:L-ascorbate metabolism protein UlaG (beta-lactamase superfamily)
MVKITWLGHAAFHIEENGYVVLLDPWVNNPKASKSFQVTKADAILISHGHFDHIGDTVTLAKNNPSLKVFCIHEISIFLAKQGVPSGQIVGLNKGGTVDLGNGFSASFTTAVHSSSCGDQDTQIPGGEAGKIMLRNDESEMLHWH